MKTEMNRKLSLILVTAISATLILSGCGGNVKEIKKPLTFNGYAKEKEAAVKVLTKRMQESREKVYVYKDFGLTDNHFTQKAKMFGMDGSLVRDMDENWQTDPYEGTSCIRCEQITRTGDWGGWLFLNGYLPKGETTPKLNDGKSGGQGLNLTGADALSFYAKGEKGGETVEFFTCGFGYDGTTGIQTVEYPDSTKKKTLGTATLTDEWQEYVISLSDADMSYIVCGFGYVLNDVMDGNADNVFYLDEIKFTGEIEQLSSAPLMIRSYDTENIYIKNVAFSYDVALVAMAFISEGMQNEAKGVLDSFIYAINNDRAGANPKRVRNGYAAGDISSFPGWDAGARLPGWYDNDDRMWYEDRYQVGSNVGNTSYVALALLQYYSRYGGEEYLETASEIMDWVIERCSDGRDGFTGGFDGWEEENPPVVYEFTYKSIEHNIDAYAAFKALAEFTGGQRYTDAAQSAKRFVESMYDKENGLFMTGTGEDGITPNKDVVVLDAQVWCRLALGEDFKPYGDALNLVDRMKTKEGGYPCCLENQNGGYWSEGTAYTALMYREIGDASKYDEAMNSLVNIQKDGLFPAATVDNLSTGMYLFTGEPWEYSSDLHIAPAAWFIMAANGFNPYDMK